MGPKKMLFTGQNSMRPKNYVLVMGEYWRLLAKMSEPSVLGGQGWAIQKQLNR